MNINQTVAKKLRSKGIKSSDSEKRRRRWRMWKIKINSKPAAAPWSTLYGICATFKCQYDCNAELFVCLDFFIHHFCRHIRFFSRLPLCFLCKLLMFALNLLFYVINYGCLYVGCFCALTYFALCWYCYPTYQQIIAFFLFTLLMKIQFILLAC